MMTGELAALATALCWTIAARLFAQLGSSFSALSLNLAKGLAAVGMLLPFAIAGLSELHLQFSALLWLLLSGAIGIGIGDTFFFKSLQKIGDSQSLLVLETLAPVFTALLALVWINEWLAWQQWLGIAIVITSVDMVIKIQKRQAIHILELNAYRYAALAALCQALGAVISRDILVSTGLDAITGSVLRLLGGLVIVVLLIIVTRTRIKPVSDKPLQMWSLFIAASFIGTALALSLQMLAFSHTKAAIVQTLFATSVLMSLMWARLRGENVATAVYGWTLLALVGVALMVLD
ncbi:DMT family transporter [Neptunicella marina]|uniref:DMT family transporter n=1 Tax=Neptunicella marina TaxID=2125989 RepID=A0A8J6M043_9ALTE|nr:DMT family transporter [Neptunicella marina]MBC3766835.1 DMT family transporter [Neptunicella marina]